MSEDPTNQNTFIKMATNGLFIVILAFGLSISSDVLLPLADFLKPSVAWYSAAVLGLPYVIIITSWMGFMASVEKDPYKLGSWGRARFIMDLLILLVYYLLLSVVSNENTGDDIQIFVLIPIVFLFYFIWDFFKEKEYKNEKEKLETIKRRTTITLKYFLAAIFTAVTFFIINLWFYSLEWNTVEFLINSLNWHVEGWTHFHSLNIIFVAIFMFLVIRYRYAKATKRRQKKST